jgi:cell division protein FtsB
MKTAPIRKILAIALLAFVTSCSSVKSSSEYKTLKTKNEAIKSEILSLDKQIKDAGQLSTKLSELKAERMNLQNQIANLAKDSEVFTKILNNLHKASCTAFGKQRFKLEGVMENNKYDENWWAAVQKEMSEKELRWFYKTDKTFAPAYSQLGSKLNSKLDYYKCTDDAFNAEITKQCKTFDKLILKRNPDQFVGKCLTGSARIAQADANTGPCAFQVYVGGGYEVRAQFGAVLDPEAQSTFKDCSTLAKNLTEGKTIRFWGFGVGSYSYTTTNNGNMTIPAFKIIATN